MTDSARLETALTVGDRLQLLGTSGRSADDTSVKSKKNIKQIDIWAYNPIRYDARSRLLCSACMDATLTLYLAARWDISSFLIVFPVCRDLHQVLDEVFQEEICQEYWISASVVQRWPS